MPSSPRKKNWKRRIIWIGALLLLIVGVLSFTADRIVERIIRGELNSAELNFYGIDYRLDVANISTSILGRSVILENVHFIPQDTAALDQQKDTVQLKIIFERLKLGAMALRELLKEDSLNIGHIELKNAEVTVFVNLDKLDPDNIQFVPEVKGLFSSNNIGRLVAENANIRITISEHGIAYRSYFEPTDLRLEGPRTLPEDSTGIKRFIFEHFELHSDQVLVDLDNGKEFRSTAFSLNSTDSTIHISEMTYGPMMGTPKLKENEVRTINWTKIVAEELQIKGVELLRLLHGEGFHAVNVRLAEPHISMYQSFFVEDSVKAAKNKQLPGPIIRNLKRQFYIEHLEIINGHIEYEEVYDTIAEPIDFVVRNLDLAINNFTPRIELLKNNDLLSVEFSATLLDTVNMNTTMQIPVLSNNGRFTMIGHLDEFDFSIFNPFVLSSKIKFKSGHMSSMDFEFTANNERSTGTLLMDYTDLHIQLLKDKKIIPLRLTKHNVLTSFLLNKLIKSNNSREKNNFRPGVINVQRDPSANFLIYIYENAVAGMISSMSGVDDALANRFPTEEKSKSKKQLRQDKKRNKKYSVNE